jgi:hypothetical protein
MSSAMETPTNGDFLRDYGDRQHPRCLKKQDFGTPPLAAP